MLQTLHSTRFHNSMIPFQNSKSHSQFLQKLHSSQLDFTVQIFIPKTLNTIYNFYKNCIPVNKTPQLKYLLPELENPSTIFDNLFSTKTAFQSTRLHNWSIYYQNSKTHLQFLTIYFLQKLHSSQQDSTIQVFITKIRKPIYNIYSLFSTKIAFQSTRLHNSSIHS